MCTAIHWNGFFGRTLDYEMGYGEEVIQIPQNFPLHFRHRNTTERHLAILGMGIQADGYPLFFDAVNECGVAMAGLNFVGNASFEKASQNSVASFEFIPYILSQAENIKEAGKLLYNLSVCDTPFSEEMPAAPLHWMLADKDDALTVEITKNGMNVYDNRVGVLTNNPPFPYQLTHLSTFLGLTSKPVTNTFSQRLELTESSRGMGAIGLPGDFSSPSRFVRASFIKENAETGDVTQFFHIMSAVEVPLGCVRLSDQTCEYTRYTSCMDLENILYHYRTYGDTAIKTVSLTNL